MGVHHEADKRPVHDGWDTLLRDRNALAGVHTLEHVFAWRGLFCACRRVKRVFAVGNAADAANGLWWADNYSGRTADRLCGEPLAWLAGVGLFIDAGQLMGANLPAV